MLDDAMGRTEAAQLDAVRMQVQAAFEVLTQTLGRANDGLSEVRAQVDRLNDVMGRFANTGAEGAQLRDGCATACGLLRTEMQEMTTDSLGTALSEATKAIDTIARETRQLAVVSTMTRITASAMGMLEINGFVDSLREMTRDVGEAGAALSRGIRGISAANEDARSSLGAATAQAVSALHAAEERSSGRAGLEQRHSALVATLENVARRIDSTGREETAALVSGIQLSDELAQRLSHVQAILEDGVAAPEARARLASAQIAAMQRDVEAVLVRLRQALEQLRDAGRQTAVALASDLGAEVEALLQALGEDLDGAARMDETMGPALTVALTASREIRSRVGVAREEFRRMRDTEQRIRLAAVNAGLLAARWGTMKTTMDVLSRAVQASAEVCSVRTESCRAAFDRIDAVLARSRLDDLESAATEVQRLVADGKQQHAIVGEAFSGLSAMRSLTAEAAEELEDTIAAALGALDDLAGPLSTLGALGQALAPMREPAAAQLAGLSHLRDLYTMQSERAVHAAVCGETAAPPPPEEQSLEDVFF